MNILIKLTCLVGLVIAPILAKQNNNPALPNRNIKSIQHQTVSISSQWDKMLVLKMEDFEEAAGLENDL